MDKNVNELNNNNACRSVERHVEMTTPEVKSKAIVKFNLFNAPVAFKSLACNTDLNQPPSNWMTTSASTKGLHQSLYHSSEFPSFGMAHMFPDCVGKVDVVSDAENIKKLLQLPYNKKGVISMIVHKVGNTLLLDEFDIQRYLLRQASDEWNWLQAFILEQVLSLSEKNCNICLKDKSREELNRKNLLSKFLYYSLMQASTSEDANTSAESSTAPKRHSKPPAPLSLTGPVLPEPKIETNVPDPTSTHVFNRNVVWTFEDIRMLIGTDMPIFGGPNRPCISLRLRDMAKPINVLTGIDYWLDNLMCNVPEVLMCYHLDGIVQRYEIIKTEDLPELEDSQFSPQLVRNMAQNILAFLKSNATKAGHTYWLFKGRNDEVVKLYDLTTLCNHQQANNKTNSRCHDETDKQENPFTTPVAMLLYSVARNMKNSSTRIGPKTAGNIKALLDNCLQLLCRKKYPQIVTSSHYILSDLYVPAGVDPKSPKFDFSDADSDTQSLFDDDYGDSNSDVDSNFDGIDKETDDEAEESANSHYEQGEVAIQKICETLKDSNAKTVGKNTKQRSPSPLQADTEERCRIALEHIRDGLITLQFFDANEEKFIKETEQRAKDEEKQRILHEEQHPNMAKPAKPIPLPYESLSTKKAEVIEIDTTSGDAEALVSLQLNGETSDVTDNASAKEPIDSPSRYTKSPTYNPMQNRQVAISFNSHNFGSWNAHLRLLLLEKACLVYAVLAEHYYIEQRYGRSLSAIYMASRCQQVVRKYLSSIASQKSCLLGRAGDCFFQMTKNWQNIDEYMMEFQLKTDTQQELDNVLEEELDGETPELIQPVQNMEYMMVFCCKCYENALECAERTASYELQRRLGNMRNELGLKYMYWAQDEYENFVKLYINTDTDSNSEKEASNSYDARVKKLKKKLSLKCKRKAAAAAVDTTKGDPLFLCLMKKCYDCLNRAIEAFTLVNDYVNQAFVYLNLARLMRLRAHMTLPNERFGFINEQKVLYNRAFNYYDKAKEALGSRKANADLWDLVNWELSTAVFTMAKHLQDNGIPDNISQSELEKEVLDALQRALKLCDVEHAGSRQVLYHYRAGLIHKRIASFHYHHLRTNFVDMSALSKTTLQLCKHHYEKAAEIFEATKEANDLLTVQLERISLFEWLAEKTNHPLQKLKNMRTVLEICLSMGNIFEQLKSMRLLALMADDNAILDANETNAVTDAINDVNNKDLVTSMEPYVVLFENRLQNCLKTLAKLSSSIKDPKKLGDIYKQMYMETLKSVRVTGAQKLLFKERAAALEVLISKLQHIYTNAEQSNETKLSKRSP